MKSTKLFLLVVLFLASCGAPATSAPMPTETFTPVPTVTQTLVPTPTITPAPTQVGGGSGRFVFTYRKDEFLAAFPDLKGETNVFVANIDGTNVTPITIGLDGNNYLMSVSPDGSKILVISTSKLKNKEANLYLVNLDSLESEPIKLADDLPNYYGNNSSAKWINDSEIIYIGQGKAGFGIYKINTDGTNPINIYKHNNDVEGDKPFELLAIDSKRIYWNTRITTSISSNTVYHTYSLWWSSLDGGERNPLEFDGKQVILKPDGSVVNIVFSPDGTKIAWGEQLRFESVPPYSKSYLHIASISDINNPYSIQTLSNPYVIKWFPDGTNILVFDLWSQNRTLEEYIEFYKKYPEDFEGSINDLYGVYQVSTSPNLSIRNYNFTSETMGSLNANAYMDLYDVSPDSRQIILSTYEKDDKGSYDTTLKLFNLDTLTFSDVSGFTFANTAINGIHWIP